MQSIKGDQKDVKDEASHQLKQKNSFSWLYRNDKIILKFTQKSADYNQKD